MEYKLRNGKTVIIRKPAIADAKGIIDLISVADTETKFLARNPGEFQTTEEQEQTYISSVLNDNSSDWFVVEYEEEIIGQCSVGLVSKNERHRHRAEVTFVVMKEYWGVGIGGKLMQQCIAWCKSKDITQIELRVIADNTHAIKMYESFGFKITGTIPKAMKYKDNSFADEYLMVLEL